MVRASLQAGVVAASLLLAAARTSGGVEAAGGRSADDVRFVEGVVVDPRGDPLQDAVVRVQATSNYRSTGPDGRFRLERIPSSRLRVTAWKDGYYVAGTDARPGQAGLHLTLEPYVSADQPDYEWIAPEVPRPPPEEARIRALLDEAARVSVKEALLPLAERLELGCRDCHLALYDQWAASGHARGAGNAVFLSTYNGTDALGNRSPPTGRAHSRDYGSLPLRPDPTVPYYGPGYKLDFPRTSGNCAACHLPAAALGEPYGIDPNTVRGVEARGSHCDFCHKIVAVSLDPATGRPRPNMPGVMSLALRRPAADRQLFFGPYDDVDLGPDTYLPLMEQSQICAPCHDASFWGVPIYASFAEWLASPYAERDETCQDCHMRPDGTTQDFAPLRGGVRRDPQTIPTHAFPGAASEELLRRAVTLRVQAARSASEVRVVVSITNDGTGHHVPTDSPLRQLILLVRATDDGGLPLELIAGPRVPDWAGTRSASPGHYGGLPGKGFAKILQSVWTRQAPTVEYWNPTRILRDDRIAAMATDTSEYRFRAANGPSSVEVTLLFRRAFIELAELKGWRAADILMAREDLVLGPQ